MPPLLIFNVSLSAAGINNTLSDLSIESVRAGIEGCSIGRDLRYFPVLDSTNRLLADLPFGDWTSGTVVLADFQQAGRGRSGRSWYAPAGTSVMFSVILQRQPTIATADYTMMFALAVRDAVAGTSALDVRLKWPNDLLAAREKSGRHPRRIQSARRHRSGDPGSWHQRQFWAVSSATIFQTMRPPSIWKLVRR